MRRREWPTLNWASLLLLATLTACGSGADEAGSPPPPAAVSILAYVASECRLDAGVFTIRQSLQIRQGEQAPITVVEHSAVVAPGAGGPCFNAGRIRHGPAFGELGVFRRLGVTPDGSQVVFEVTDEVTDSVQYPLLFPPNALPPEQKGIFAVRADGSGLHRVGPASSVASFWRSLLTFSPNGRTIAYTDRGPSRDNEDAAQIFTLDLVTGERRQVTQLPPASGDFFLDTYGPFFNDDQTITFSTLANADGNHLDGENIVVTVKTDEGGLTVARPPIAVPGSEVLTSFRITSSGLDAAVLPLPGAPVNPGINGNFSILEVLTIDRDNNILQLTNFRRSDTFTPTVSADGQRVVFSASTNRLGTNPTETCQLFSVDRNGGDLRQLTNFEEHPEGRPSTGCTFGPWPSGCAVYQSSRDLRSDAVVFYSTCDPFGTNPYGMQVFAIQSDGTGLRQITNTQGYTRDASGAVTVEVPYPLAWPGAQLR